MRILFFGNAAGAIDCLKVLLKRGQQSSDLFIVAPHGGKLHYWNESLKDFCDRMGLNCICPENVNDEKIISKFKKFKPDVIFSVYYTQILSDNILGLVKYSINFHPSLLPKYRGTAPLIWAIVKGENETGITAHEMTSAVDKGKVYGRIKIPIAPDDTGFSLYGKAVKATSKLFGQILNKVEKDDMVFTCMEEGGSYYSNKTPRVNELKPKEQTRKEIYNIVRALSKPLPAAYILDNHKKIFINKVKIINDKVSVEDDRVFFEKGNQKFIRAKDGFLVVLDWCNKNGQ